MPFKAFLAHPLVLGAVTVIAIGVITYQILNSRKQKRKYTASGRSGRPPSDSGDYPVSFEKPNNDLRRRTKPDNGPTKSSKTDTGSLESRKPDSGPTKSSKTDTGSLESKKPDSGPTTLVKTYNGPAQPRKSDNDPTESENSTNKFCDVKNLSDTSNGSSNGNPELSSKVSEQFQSTDGNNVNQNDLRKPDFVKNIDDEDSDSSESNTSSNSIESSGMRSAAEDTQCSYESIERSESSSPVKDKNCGDNPFLDKAEEMYKREIYDNLKRDVEDMNLSSKRKADSKSYNDEDSECDVSLNSNNANGSEAVAKKRIICKGCIEELANAVAYPCGHCYLCFDCAIKVHRIYKKCTICNLVIETYETL